MRMEDLRSGRLSGGLDAAIEQRLPFVAGFMVVVFVIFAVRLFQLQLIEGEQLGRLSTKNSVRSVRLEAPRGDILDRNGKTLASTRPAFGVQVMPSDLQNRERTLRAVGMLLGEDPGPLDERIGAPRGRRRFQLIRLASDVSYDQLARVESHRFALPGVETDMRPRRDYVEGDLAAHLLGYIGQIQGSQLEQERYRGYRSGEVIGQAGIETLYERALRGRQGGRNLVVDAAGRVVEVLDEELPVPGGTLTLTLDRDLQRVAEKAFLPDVLGEPGKQGALVAMDVRTGDVLALLSKPSYDPNSFAGGIDAETWERLTTDEWRPIQNRAVSGQYPPGSLYKAIVAAAALEEGAIAPEERLFCPGHFKLGRRTYRCWKRGGHGAVALHDALKGSCDVYFYQVGLRLGIDRIADYARRFSLGRRTGIALGQESAGLVPTSAWKERRFGEVWMKGETVSASIGQGFDLVTPLQIAVAYTALANGGKILRPRLVLRTQNPDGVASPGPPVEVLGNARLAPANLARVVVALEAVVGEDGGTARRARVPGVRVAGKTGTAQVVRLKHTEDLEDDEVPIRFRDHAWFVAFAPVEAPEIVVVALVEHGGHGGSAAAPIVQRVLSAYFHAEEAPPPSDGRAAEVEVVRN
ncbi:MAG: penicillin-binding protein 2 [Myxococcota bacterium]